MARTKPLGSVCTIAPYRWRGPGDGPSPGAFIVTRGGSAYRVLEVKRGKLNPRNLRLTCARCDFHHIPPGAETFELLWDSRNPRK